MIAKNISLRKAFTSKNGMLSDVIVTVYLNKYYWAGKKKIIDLELPLYLLKRTILCKSYDVQGKIISVVIFVSVYVYKDFPLLLKNIR